MTLDIKANISAGDYLRDVHLGTKRTAIPVPADLDPEMLYAALPADTLTPGRAVARTEGHHS